jgi:hypothetical protein
MKDVQLVKLLGRIEKLEDAVFRKKKQRDAKSNADISEVRDAEIDFAINPRAFVKRYAAGKSGPKKFTLLIAYFAKGKIGINIPLSQVVQNWNKMSAKGLLGKFNRFYPNQARTNGWIDSTQRGTYCLTKEWRDSF